MTVPRRALPALLGILLLATISLRQETSSPGTDAEFSHQEALIRKGRTEWGLLAGMGLARDAGEGFGDLSPQEPAFAQFRSEMLAEERRLKESY